MTVLLSVISSCRLCSWTSSSVCSLPVYSFIPSLLVLCLPNDNTNGVELVEISVLQCIAQLLKNSVDSKSHFLQYFFPQGKYRADGIAPLRVSTEEMC